MHSTSSEATYTSFKELDSEARRNAISLNFQQFINEKRMNFSENHVRIKKEITRIKKQWGLERLAFTINSKNTFQISAGTLSDDFFHTATCLLQQEKDLSKMAVIEEAREAQWWLQSIKMVEGEPAPKLNYQYKKEPNPKIASEMRKKKITTDVLIETPSQFASSYELTQAELKERIRLLSKKADPETKKKLREMSLKAVFEKNKVQGELNRLMMNVSAAVEIQREKRFECYLETQLKTVEKELTNWLQTIDLRQELENYLTQHEEYTFSPFGWMKIKLPIQQAS